MVVHTERSRVGRHAKVLYAKRFAPIFLLGIGLCAILAAFFVPGRSGRMLDEARRAEELRRIVIGGDARVALDRIAAASEDLVRRASEGEANGSRAENIVESLLTVGLRLPRPFSPETRASLLVPLFHLRKAAAFAHGRRSGTPDTAIEPWMKTVDVLIEILDRPASGAELVLTRAVDQYTGCGYREAMELCQALESMGPTSALVPARLLRGLCLAETGRVEEGSQLMTATCEDNRKSGLAPLGLFWSAVALYCDGKVARATELFKTVMERYPGRPEAERAGSAFLSLQRNELDDPFVIPHGQSPP